MFQKPDSGFAAVICFIVSESLQRKPNSVKRYKRQVMDSFLPELPESGFLSI